MLTPAGSAARRQAGFSLIVALIALVIMALAATSLMRTVATSTLVSGNMAYEQAAVTASDAGVEAAIVWLENNVGKTSSASALACGAAGSTVLACDQPARAYLASRSDPAAGQNWADVWANLTGAGGATPASLAEDAAGNRTAYLIQRMCAAPGDASSLIGCSAVPSSGECGSSHAENSNAGAGNLSCGSVTYYRITVRVAGPRGTLGFIQAMVAL